MQGPDASLVDPGRSLSSIGVMPMSLGQMSQMQLHQMPPGMLQSLGPPQLHPITSQMQLHQLHSIAYQQQPTMGVHPSMVVVGHSGHSLVDPSGAGSMEPSGMEGSQQLDAIVAAAAVSGTCANIYIYIYSYRKYF